MHTAGARIGGSLACLLVAACSSRTGSPSSPSACPCASGASCCDAVCVVGGCPSDAGQAPDATTSKGGTDSAPPVETFTVLDSMTSDTTTLGTPWYTFSDRTCPYSCPPLYLSGATGTLWPAENTQFLPSTAGDGPTIGGTVWPYREVRGGGESHWGMGFGFDLHDVRGPSPAASCPPGFCTGTLMDAGEDAMPVDASSEDAGDPGPPCSDGTFAFRTAPYDASAHAGISFWVRAPDATGADSPTLELFLSDKQTNPAGGMCNACASGGTGACNDDFAFAVMPLTSTWTERVVPFAQLVQAGWSGTKGILDLTTLGHVNFGIQTQLNGSPLPSFRVQVAYVQWMDE
jgi:hypothetical protein